MVVFKQDTTSVSTICDWANQTLRQFRPSVSRACEACNRKAYSQAAFVTVPGQGHLLLSVWLRLPIYLVTGICSCNASLFPSTLAFGKGLIFPMERISGSLALAISEHRLGDALYALLLSRHAKEP